MPTTERAMADGALMIDHAAAIRAEITAVARQRSVVNENYCRGLIFEQIA